MIKSIVRDIFFLGQKSEDASRQDLSIGQDLQDTLNANQDKGSIGFYWGAEDGGPFTTSPHKVFLAVPRGEAHAAAMPFDGTTGLAGVKTVQSENNDIYSLSGIKVNGNKLPKGVYITNGKKVVIK